MAGSSGNSLSSSPRPLTPSEQAHRQIMDLLQQADKSKNPAIAKISAAMAQEQARFQQESARRLSPVASVSLVIFVAFAAVISCWYVLTHYPTKVGMEISGIIIALTVLVMAFCALYSGHLTQANFMFIFRWAGDRFKHLFTSNSSEAQGKLALDASQDDLPETKPRKRPLP